MISIRVSTNKADKILQGELVKWMTSFGFSYDQLTHDWIQQPKRFRWEDLMRKGPENFCSAIGLGWDELFIICKKFEAEIVIRFDRVKAPRR